MLKREAKEAFDKAQARINESKLELIEAQVKQSYADGVRAERERSPGLEELPTGPEPPPRARSESSDGDGELNQSDGEPTPAMKRHFDGVYELVREAWDEYEAAPADEWLSDVNELVLALRRILNLRPKAEPGESPTAEVSEPKAWVRFCPSCDACVKCSTCERPPEPEPDNALVIRIPDIPDESAEQATERVRELANAMGCDVSFESEPTKEQS